MKNYFKQILMFSCVLAFVSCSDDDKKNKSKELEYRVDVETVANPILTVVYIDKNGEQVTVTGDDESITTSSAMTTFSKKLRITPPFEAQMTVTLQNSTNVGIPFMISIVEDGVVALSDNLVIPANSPTEASLSYALQIEE